MLANARTPPVVASILTRFQQVSTASALQSSAVGYNASAGQFDATAVGSGASVTHVGSTAVGKDATSTAANQVTLGGAGSSVRVGDIDASTNAQVGPVDVVTVDANGTLGRQQAATAASVQNVRVAVDHIAAVSDAQFNALSNDVGLLSGQVETLFDLSETNRENISRANEGVALALAMESPSLPAGTTFALSGGIGNYQGRTSLAMAVSAAVNEQVSVSAGVGVGAHSGEVGSRAGFQIAW